MGRLGIWLLVGATLLAACAAPSTRGTPSASQPDKLATPKKITLGVRSNGAISYQVGTDGFAELFLAGLVDITPAGAPVAQLAEALPTVENGLWKLFPDGRMETTLTIRPGARWHDGAPFTAADAIFGLAVAREFSTENVAAVSASIEKLEAPDARTLVVSWKNPSIVANWLFSYSYAPPLPSHLLEEAFKQDPSSIMNHRYFATDVVGNGAFVIREFQAGSYSILRANDDYVLGRPRVDEITVRYIPDANALAASTLTGEIDLTIGTGLSVEQAVRVKEGWVDGEILYSKYFQTQAVIYPQFLNPDPPILLNLMFRRAMAHAIDRAELLESIQGGVGAVASVLVAPTDPDYEEVKHAIVEYPYDPRRASRLLEGIGYANGTDGVFRDASGRELKFELQTTLAGESVYEQTTLSVADYWKRVGVVAEPRVVSARNDPSIMALRSGFTADRLMTQLDARFLSTSAPTTENRFVGTNRARYQNPELDALLSRYLVTVPRPERLGVLADVMRHMTENVVVIHLFYNVGAQMKHQRLKNVEPRTSKSRIFNAYLWDLG